MDLRLILNNLTNPRSDVSVGEALCLLGLPSYLAIAIILDSAGASDPLPSAITIVSALTTALLARWGINKI